MSQREAMVAPQAGIPPHMHARLAELETALGAAIRGKPEVVRLSLVCLLARGHLLIEDVPGVGKTTLARAVARALGDSFSRIQFTADMLPSDVLGVQVLDSARGTFDFKPGPLFAQVVLADEINRASPKTQSATLEAMGEGAVTVDDQTYRLPQPFVVIATQNPVEHHGAYPLPESQLDRFAVSLSLGYPDAEHELALLDRPGAPERRLQEIRPSLPPAVITALQQACDDVRLARPVATYLLAIVSATREHPDVLLGCSPRGSLQLAAVARAWAFMEGRDYVLPDDVKSLAAPVLAHRIVAGGGAGRAAARQGLDGIGARPPGPR